MKCANNMVEVIGNTPLVRLHALTEGMDATVLVKLEYLNPGGSTKDRIGIRMIEAAEQQGLLHPGDTIVEPTSGNTGVGLAIAAAVKGYHVVFTMSTKMSQEKEMVLRAYGAEVIRAPAEAEPDSPEHYISVAKRIAAERQAYLPNQYDNPANPEAHYLGTGPEIWRDTDGRITHYVAAMGTGGTISGAAKFLKEQNPHIRVIGADPEGSLLHHYFHRTEGRAYAYKVEGPGEDFMPGAMDFSVIDDVIVVSDRNAFATARALVQQEGIFAGGSSGLAVSAALQIAKTAGPQDVIVIPLPDSGRNYVSKIYNDSWMMENNLL